MITNNIHSALLSTRTTLTAICLVAMSLVGVSKAFAADGPPAASQASASTKCSLLSGYQFTLPADWRAETIDEAVRVRPAGSSENEVYAMSSGMMDGVTSLTAPGLPTAVDAEAQKYLPLLKRVGAPAQFITGCGPALAFSYHNQSKADMDGLLLLTIVKGRAVFMLALAPNARLTSLQKSLTTLFGSLTAVQETPATAGAADHSPLAQQWNNRLRNKKLVYLSSYSSGNSGGYSSQKEMRLFADGRLTYSSNSSVSISVPGANGGSAGRNAGQGAWSIHVRNNTAYLTVIENGQKGEIPLQYRDNKTFLNGVRFFVVDL